MTVRHIVVVGSSNMDLVAKAPRIPVPGETLTGTDFFIAPGGKGANQAVAAAKLGADVIFVAKLALEMLTNGGTPQDRETAVDLITAETLK